MSDRLAEMNQPLLMIEDDARLAAMVSDYLGQSGYSVQVCGSGSEGLARLEAAHPPPQLLILDLMLPDMDGLEICRRIRALPSALAQTPILMLTAKGDPMDRVIGLEIGADDYLAKPFEPEELLLRIEAILRRARDRPSGDGPLSLGRCEFDPDRGELTCDGEPVRLTEAEVALLRQLARTPHEPVDRLELAHGAVDPSGRAVDVQVTRLRRKIEDDPKAPRYLQTVRGVGYRLAPD